MQTESSSLWRRPCGLGEVLTMAIPLIISTMSFTVMTFVDRMFLSWDSSEAMAASLPAGMVNWTMMSLPMGIAGYVNTFVAQYHGAGRNNRIGTAVWQGMRVALYAMPLFLLGSLFAPQLFTAFGHPEEVLWMEVLYMQVLAYSACAVPFAAAMSSFFIGRGQTRVVMVVNILAAALNIVLDYLWIFGHAGFPAAGIEGAAWATVVSQWFKVAVYAAIMFAAENRRLYGTWSGRAPDWALFRRLLKYGFPNGLQYIVEGSAMTLFALVIGQLGSTQAAATSVAFNVNMMAFIPMLGVGIAVSTFVGRELGANRPELAARSTWSGIILSLAYTGVFGVLYLCIPGVFMLGFEAGGSDFSEIRPMAVILLRFVAAYCLFDALQIIFVSALKGAGDTRFVMLNTIATSAAFVVIGLAGARYGDWGVYQWWSLLTGWLMLLSLIYGVRFVRGKWRDMRVIESEPVIEVKPKRSVGLEELEPAVSCAK